VEELVRRVKEQQRAFTRKAKRDSPADAGSVKTPEDRERKALLSAGPAGLVVGAVRDARTGRPMAARVLVEDGGGTEAGAVLRGVGFWADGVFSVAVVPGLVRVRVTAGRRRAVDRRDLRVRPGGKVRFRVDLAQPEVLRFEEEGWFGTDLFRPVAGGDELRGEATLDTLALAARAEGAAFVGAAEPWSARSLRRGADDLLEVLAACDRLSRRGCVVSPVVRGTDAPFYGDSFFLGATRGARLAPVGWEVRWPNFLAIEEARAQGAVSVLTRLTEARELDPRAEIVPFGEGLDIYYREAPVALRGLAAELPFDVAAGVLPDALALSGSASDEAVWFRLLEMGYRVPSVHAVTGSFAEGVVPAERTFVRLGRGARPAAEAICEAIRAGRVMCSNGPFVFLEIAGRGPGAVLQADGRPRKIALRAFGSTEAEGELARVELVRNGEVVREAPGEGQTTILAELDVYERETAWYIARALSGPEPGRVAWTSPVYFEGAEYAPPRPVLTRVSGRVTDELRAPLAATVEARLLGRLVASAATDPRTGRYVIEVSPASRLDVKAGGHVPESVRIFFHTKAPDEIRAIHTNASGRGAAVLAEEETYERMRLAAAEAEIDWRLKARE
jgi:hypothetical protein